MFKIIFSLVLAGLLGYVSYLLLFDHTNDDVDSDVVRIYMPYDNGDVRYQVIHRLAAENNIQLQVIRELPYADSMFRVPLTHDRDSNGDERVLVDLVWIDDIIMMNELVRRGQLSPNKGNGWQRTYDSFRHFDGMWVATGGQVMLEVKSESSRDNFHFVNALMHQHGTDNVIIFPSMTSKHLFTLSAVAQAQGLDVLLNLISEGVLAQVQAVDNYDEALSTLHDKPNGTLIIPHGQFYGQSGATNLSHKPLTADGSGQFSYIIEPDIIALVRNSPSYANARVLIDEILSEQSLTELANSPKRILPLMPLSDGVVTWDKDNFYASLLPRATAVEGLGHVLRSLHVELSPDALDN